MTHRDFCYWLKTFAKSVKNEPTELQWKEIKQQLQVCFDSEPTHVPYPFKDRNHEKGLTSEIVS